MTRPSHPERVRLGSIVAVVCDQRRPSVLCDPPSQLLDQDAALRTHLHVAPPLIRLWKPSVRVSETLLESSLVRSHDRGALTCTSVEEASVGDGARTNLSCSG